jgi:hypothetical protein
MPLRRDLALDLPGSERARAPASLSKPATLLGMRFPTKPPSETECGCTVTSEG